MMRLEINKAYRLWRRPPGDFTVSWDGKNNEGTLMPDGNYGLVAAVRDMTVQILNYR